MPKRNRVGRPEFIFYLGIDIMLIKWVIVSLLVLHWSYMALNSFLFGKHWQNPY